MLGPISTEFSLLIGSDKILVPVLVGPQGWEGVLLSMQGRRMRRSNKGFISFVPPVLREAEKLLRATGSG